MAKRVEWTFSAKLCRKNILEYWFRKTGNKKYSRKISYSINKRIEFILEHPRAGKSTSIERVRTTACGHFSIFFVNDSEKITIVGFFDTRDSPDKIMKQLKEAKY